MWPTSGSGAEKIKYFKGLFICTDPSELELYGNFGTIAGKILFVDIVKCIGKDHCKTEKEIDEFFQSKFMYVLKN